MMTIEKIFKNSVYGLFKDRPWEHIEDDYLKDKLEKGLIDYPFISEDEESED